MIKHVVIEDWQESSFNRSDWAPFEVASVIRRAEDKPGERFARYCYLHELGHLMTTGGYSYSYVQDHLAEFELKASSLALAWVAPKYYKEALAFLAICLHSHVPTAELSVCVGALEEMRSHFEQVLGGGR